MWVYLLLEYLMSLVSHEKKQEIKDIVKLLLWKSLAEIAKENNIMYTESDLQKIAIWIAWFIMYNQEASRFWIFIEMTDSPRRKRFTFAHELWHYFLHKEVLIGKGKVFVDTEKAYVLFKQDDVNVEESDKQQEAEANYFASELLMPEEVIKKAYEEIKSVDILSEIFMVSSKAMRYRLINLGLISNEDVKER